MAARNPIKTAAAGIVAQKAYDSMGGDPAEVEKLSEEEVVQIVEEAIKTEEKINPDFFESHGLDVSPYDYLRTKPGTSEVEMTPEMIKRDEAALKQFLKRGSPKGR